VQRPHTTLVPLILSTESYFGLLKVRLSFAHPHRTLRLNPGFAMNVSLARWFWVRVLQGSATSSTRKEAQTKIEGEKTWDTVTADEIHQGAFPSSLTTSWSRRSAMTDTSVLKVPERPGKQKGPPELARQRLIPSFAPGHH
jgi:hypothetical protein